MGRIELPGGVCHGALAQAVFLLLWLALLISMLASTADDYFVPQLEALSDRLGLQAAALASLCNGWAKHGLAFQVTARQKS